MKFLSLLFAAVALASACASADDMQNRCDNGWQAMMATWHEKTGLVYGCPPERVRSSKDCVNGMFHWKEGGGVHGDE